MAGGETGWDAFGGALAGALSQLQDRSHLLVSWADVPTVYAQFAQSSTELVVVTGADDVLPPDRRLGADGAARLQASGWSPPTAGVAGKTWHFAVPWPARSADYRRVAGLVVEVFRDVHRVPGANALEYRGWRDAQPGPEGVTYYEEDLEPAEPHLTFPDLEIRDAQEA